MADMITIPSHCMVTVQRPSGAVEILDYTKATKGQVRTMTDGMLAVVNKAMAAAKRGQIIAFENVSAQVAAPKPTAADLAEERHIAAHNAILRASAGGERADRIRGVADDDATPAHKAD